jgi:hypothetical protein
MEVGGLSHERGGRSGAARRSTGSRNRRTRRAHTAAIRSESQFALPVDRAAEGAPPATADHQQAEYFVRLLTQSRRLSEHRIDEYRKAIASSEANSDADAASSFRRMARMEEQDRETVDGLIEQLYRRFPRPAPKEASVTTARTRLVAR